MHLDVTNASFFPKVMTVGQAWQWTGFSDYMWARMVLCMQGKLSVSSVPISSFEAKIKQDKWSVSKLANHIKNMKASEILEHQGLLCVLEPGMGVVIPPGHMAHFCGQAAQLETEQRDKEGAVFLVP